MHLLSKSNGRVSFTKSRDGSFRLRCDSYPMTFHPVEVNIKKLGCPRHNTRGVRATDNENRLTFRSRTALSVRMNATNGGESRLRVMTWEEDNVSPPVGGRQA